MCKVHDDLFIFFFQAEDGIRDYKVTGVQTCALPILPEEPVAIPFGKGRIVRPGTDVTIVGASLMAHEANRAADLLAEDGISAEVIDPRSIRPLDEEIILNSIAKTRHLVVVDTSWATYGFAAEVAAVAAAKGFAHLHAPV